MNILIVLPILVPLVTLLLALLVKRHHRWVTVISLSGAVVLLLTGLYLVALAAGLHPTA